MARKNASLHLITRDRKTVLPAVTAELKRTRKEFTFEDILRNFKTIGVGGIGSDPFDISMDDIDAFRKIVANSAYAQQKLTVTEDFISVYDESWAFETVEEYAAKYSEEFGTPIFAYAIFDDDILCFTLCREGKIVSQGHLGALEAFGEAVILPDIKKLLEVVGTISDLCVLSNMGAENTVSEWEEAIQLDLGLTLQMDETLPLLKLEEALMTEDSCQVNLHAI